MDSVDDDEEMEDADVDDDKDYESGGESDDSKSGRRLHVHRQVEVFVGHDCVAAAALLVASSSSLVCRVAAAALVSPVAAAARPRRVAVLPSKSSSETDSTNGNPHLMNLVEQSNKLIANLQKVTDKITSALKRKKPEKSANKCMRKKGLVGPFPKRHRP